MRGRERSLGGYWQKVVRWCVRPWFRPWLKWSSRVAYVIFVCSFVFSFSVVLRWCSTGLVVAIFAVNEMMYLRHRRRVRPVLSVLLGVSDLPGGGWVVERQRAERTGKKPNLSPVVIRARNAGSITAQRAFQHGGGLRAALAQVTPTASEEDARALIEDTKEKFLNNLKRLGNRVTSGRVVEGIEVPGADDVWCYEHALTRETRNSIRMWLTGRVGEYTFVVGTSAPAGGWSWDDVIALAARQAQLLRELVA